MGTDQHSSSNGQLPEHDTVSFEPRDISISSVLWSLFYLAVTVLVSLGICVLFLKFTTKFVASQDTPRPMVRQQMSAEEEMRTSMPQDSIITAILGKSLVVETTISPAIAGWVCLRSKEIEHGPASCTGVATSGSRHRGSRVLFGPGRRHHACVGLRSSLKSSA